MATVWLQANGKMMSGDFHFLDKLVGYDRDSMTDEVMNQIKVRKVAGGHAPGQCEGGQEWASQFHHSYSCFTHLPLPPPPHLLSPSSCSYSSTCPSLTHARW